MESKEVDFQAEVLIRLGVIESKLDGYKETKKTVYEADNRSRQNTNEIEELQDKLKWLSRTTGAAIISAIIGTVFIFLKIGMGVN